MMITTTKTTTSPTARPTDDICQPTAEAFSTTQNTVTLFDVVDVSGLQTHPNEHFGIFVIHFPP